MIAIGKKAPAFSLPSTLGRKLALKDFAGKKVVLYFYPKDDTPGCTKEACSFQDSLSSLARAGAVVLGVSADPVMHGTMEKTHEGVHHGTVKIAKNADKLETFVKMDKDFHGELEKLADAAKNNDGQAMLALTKGLLDGCVKCHGMFR